MEGFWRVRVAICGSRLDDRLRCHINLRWHINIVPVWKGIICSSLSTRPLVEVLPFFAAPPSSSPQLET